jgi:hypothetical protein
MSTIQPLRLFEKIALVFEILTEYVPSWRILGEPNIIDMVRAVREVEPSRSPLSPVEEHDTARRLGRAVQRTLRLLPTDSRCLIRSLVLTRLLARRSIPNTLVIGVRKTSEFEAHAWIEHDGQPILPAGDYTRLTEL